ncbi:hypothetical protein M409DRAFT_50924 [Zasmidium cellare ATCC 36951]|uniref:Uncharacterized protein n=1 Tax=Zasmidium cellare ATCC 36951 TaxID=1080233 RepID=A0A6A6CZ95_ZASCE|nr:uncharacterized protein M409DRAFT_50924 [Zasmidium cellare ATCC 36951]KAF2171488.1 hypothetical protein M409DRAFT_50924 [Zasmidium cellare ATCC 36951]
MPGFFQGLAKAAVEGYQNAKEQQALAQREALAKQQGGYASAASQERLEWQQPQQDYRQQQTCSLPPPPPRPQRQQSQQQYQQQEVHSLPTLPPRQQSQQQQHQNVTSHPAPPAKTTSSPSPGCNGLDLIQGSQIYITFVAPDLDICPSCYQTSIAPSPFSTSFTPIIDPNPGHKTCDMAIKGVRHAWKEACARASTDATNAEIWLQRFASQSQTIMSHVTALLATITSLKEQIQLATLQAQFTQASAMNQTSHGFSMSCINSIGGGNYYDGGSVISAAGNNRFSEATRMKMDVSVKEYELGRGLAEFRALVGCGVDGRADWS